MELNDLYDAGSDIMNAVTDAINRNDYSHLSEDIRKTVEEIKITIQRDKPNGDVRRRGYGSNYYRTPSPNAYKGAGARPRYESTQVRQRPTFTTKTPFLQRKISRQSGVGKIILGIIGLLIGAPMLLFGGISAIASFSLGELLSTLIFGGGITAASLWAILSGDQEHKLVNRYYQYGKAAGEAEYIEISKLAAAVGRKTEDVRADIKKMMDKGLLPVSWLDEQETTLILSEEVYNQYLQIRSKMKEQETVKKEEEEKDGLSPEARSILREGAEYIRQIRRYNDEIPGVEMSEKLYRLENTMNRILEQVRKNPGSAPELRKLMSYYLPTTVKLLNAYRELDRQSSTGENIVNTKAEIEGALDTINEAFENLLDSLFQDMAWDISTDISVMQTMFKQDGLTEQEMKAGQAPGRPAAAESSYGTSAVHAQEEESGVKMQVGGSTLYFGDAAAQYQTQEKEQ